MGYSNFGSTVYNSLFDQDEGDYKGSGRSIYGLLAGSLLFLSTLGCTSSGLRTGPEKKDLDGDSYQESISTYWSDRVEVTDIQEVNGIDLEYTKEGKIDGEKASNPTYRIRRAKEVLEDQNKDVQSLNIEVDLDKDGREEQITLDRYREDKIDDKARAVVVGWGKGSGKTVEHYMGLEEDLDLNKTSEETQRLISRTIDEIDPSPAKVYQQLKERTYQMEAQLKFEFVNGRTAKEFLESRIQSITYDREEDKAYFLTSLHNLGPRPGTKAEGIPLFEKALKNDEEVVDEAEYLYTDRDGGSVRLEGFARDRSLDLAILTAETDNPVEPQRLGSPEELQRGDKVLVVGNNLEDGADYRTGDILGFENENSRAGQSSRKEMLVDIASFYGESGRAFYHRSDGRMYIIGINTAARHAYRDQKPEMPFNPSMSPRLKKIERFIEGSGLKVDDETGLMRPPD